MVNLLRTCGLYASAVVLIFSAFPHIALAATACNATVSPSSVVPGSEVVVQFDIQNTGSQAITWIRIGQPSPSYDINGITQSNWIDATSNTGTTLTGSSIMPGATYTLQLAMFTGPSEEAAMDWQISTSSNGDGSASIACGGHIATSIANAVAPPMPNGVSGVGLTRLSATSATVGWNSDAPSTSYVYYGFESGYGKTATTAGSDSTHRVNLTGLVPETIYHYKVAGSDANGNNFFSDDNTFVTPSAPPAIPPPTTIYSPVPAGEQSPTIIGSARSTVVVPPVPNDTTAPTVSFKSFANRPYVTSPIMAMSATDNGALARLDYSTDGGRNWLPADKIDGLGKQAATATFTPLLTQDGNYQIMVRAVDSNGNQSTDGPQTLVIDQLPPRFGNLAVSFGSQVLEPTDSEAIAVAVSGAYKVTGQAVGGATLINIIAKNKSGRVQTFSLTQDQITGLWRGALSFSTAGIYQVSVYALDGAGNETNRPLGQISAVPAGRVTDAKNQLVARAKVTVHYLEPSTERWVVWDGLPYSQINPQPVKSGNYSAMVPAGRYYMEVSAPGYGTVLSRQFTVHSPQSLTMAFQLDSHALFRFGTGTVALPSWKVTSQTPVQSLSLLTGRDTIIGTKLPNFTLPNINGGTRQTIDLYGKPTIISLLNTWSPNSIDQLSALEAANRNPNVGVVPLFEAEQASSVNAYIRLAGRNINGLADPTNSQVENVMAGFGPKHIFLDRSGHIKKVMVGVLSEEEILQNLGGN